jgi:hypothetical protein
MTKKYEVRVNGIGFIINATNRIVAVKRGIMSYYYDAQASDIAQKNRRKEIIGRRLDISVERIE